MASIQCSDLPCRRAPWNRSWYRKFRRKLPARGADQAALHQRRGGNGPVLVALHARFEPRILLLAGGRDGVERVVGALQGEAEQETQLDSFVFGAESGWLPAGDAAQQGRGFGHFLVHHGRCRFVHHGVQLAGADAFHFGQVVSVLHQHHPGFRAFQAGAGKAVQQRGIRRLVLETLRFAQAALALHEDGNGEGVDFHLGAVALAQQDGAGVFFDGFLQGAVGVGILAARQFEGAVQDGVLALAQVAPHGVAQLVFLCQREAEQLMAQGFIFVGGGIIGLAWCWALVLCLLHAAQCSMWKVSCSSSSRSAVSSSFMPRWRQAASPPLSHSSDSPLPW